MRFSRTRLSDVFHRKVCTFVQPFPFFDPDVPEGHAVNTGTPLVGTNKAIGMTEDVSPIHLVIQSIKTKGRVLLGLAVKLPL